MKKRCTKCGDPMTGGTADIEETVRGVRVRMLGVPVWTCATCGEKQVSLSVARYISEYLKRLLADPPATPDELDRPLTPKEVVFAAA